jgi:hypothetical protein
MVSHTASLGYVGGVISFVTGGKYVSCLGRGNTSVLCREYRQQSPIELEVCVMRLRRRVVAIVFLFCKISYLQIRFVAFALPPDTIFVFLRQAVHYAAVGASSQDARLSPTVP